VEWTEWQGVIASDGERTLGTQEAVAAVLIGLFPGLTFQWSPSGVEQLAFIDSRGVVVPDLVRRTFATRPSQLSGSTKAGQLEVSFNLGCGNPVEQVWATVSGPKDLAAAAFELLQRPGWILNSPEPLTLQTVTPKVAPPQPNGATLFIEE